MKNERATTGNNKTAAMEQLKKDRQKIKFEAEQLANRLRALAQQKQSNS